ASEDANPKGARYVAAVELAPGEVEKHLATAGRSAAGREVVEYLAAVGRPATVGEVVAAVDCGPAVVRRLVGLGGLRKFSQVEKLSLDHHMLGGGGAGEALQLRPDQEAALAPLLAALEARRFAPFLLAGMTGSGKTEVYLRAADATLRAGRATLLLVPEI